MTDVPSDVAGLYKYIIGGLAAAVSTLAAATGLLFKQSIDVNKSRLKERDDLREALNNATTVISNLAEAARQRNEVTQKIGDMMLQVSHAMTMLTERLELQHEHTGKDLATALDAVLKLAASVRELADDVHNLSTEIKVGVVELKSEIKTAG